MTRDKLQVAQCLFSPRHVAIIGASSDRTKHASLAQQHLRQHGFSGEIYPINSRHADVLGERAYPNIRAVGKAIDHVFINVPTSSVLSAVEDSVAAGARCATILTDGFAEAGPEGAIRQQAVIETARKGGMRVLGPNSIGIVNIVGQVALSANEVLSLERLTPGRCSLISQSGSLIGALLSRGQAREIGFSKLVSVGNEGDLGVAEIGELLIDDDDTDAILLVLETMRRPNEFAAMARRAFDKSKAVIAFQLGNSAAGAELAASHTGAMTGDGRAFDAFLRDSGVICVSHFESLIELPPLLTGQRPPKARRVATMTTTGGGAGLVVDRLAQNVVVAAPSSETRERLAARGVTIGAGKIIDLTLAGTNARTYGAVLEELLSAPDYDLVLAVVGSSSLFRPDRAVQPIVTAKAAASRPMAIFLTPQADESLRILRREGVAAFRIPEGCADSINAYLQWRSPRQSFDGASGLEGVRTILSEVDGGALDAARASSIFSALGIPRANSAIISIDAAASGARLPAGMSFPVAVKILSSDIQHKTEVGGVMLGLHDEGELRDACYRILANVKAKRPDAALVGLQVEAMEAGLGEAIVGYQLDPCVGPVVMVGSGGVLTELYRDVSVRTAPVDVATAHEMIEETRGLTPLRGYRGLPVGDIDALAQAVSAISKLALLNEPRILEAEINPVIVKPKGMGVVAVDGLVILATDAA